MSKHDKRDTPASAATGTESGEADDLAVPKDPMGLRTFKALLSGLVKPETKILRISQAATLAVYCALHPELMVDAMTTAEILAWCSGFRTTNPHAWHAALVGDMIRFCNVTQQRASDVLMTYQRETSALRNALLSNPPPPKSEIPVPDLPVA